MHDSSPSLDAAVPRVRAGLATADRLRRSRDRKRRAWRAAPYVAAAALCVGLIGAFERWPVVAPLVLLGVGLAVLAAYACLTRPTRNISDRIAAAIDADAGLQGELRSAHWFATRDTHDPWTDFHVDRAADRIASVDWSRVYPPPTERRATLTTGGLAIATLLLPLVLPGLSGPAPLDKNVNRVERSAAKTLPVPGMPVDLPRNLEAWLSAAEHGTLPPESPASAAAMRDLIDRLAHLHDADTLKRLARAMASKGDRSQSEATEDLMKALAERLERAAENGVVPPPMRDALQNLAADLSQVAQTERAANRDPRDARQGQSAPDADAVRTNASGRADDMSIQQVRDADAGNAAAILMVTDPDAGGSDPGTGLGGGSGVDAQQGRMAEIASALRRETIEANANSEGSDPLTDQRRKSEQGQATVTFTRTVPRAFDTGRAVAPPAVPESRRAAIRSYFVRHQ